MAYRTPDVYVEERSVFPPSVAQVETAIPAFIGYTEKATERNANDLHLRPTKIGSLLDFRQFFGGPPPLNVTTVELAANNSVAHTVINPRYFLFDSLQLFYANGGGDCYIISVGRYTNPLALADFNLGLAALEGADEPTLILFPDAVLLANAGELYTLQQNALAQCNRLKDRFAIFDLREWNGVVFDWAGQRDNFRNGIGANFLKYGAAYTPHLRASLPKNITYRDFRNNVANPNRFVQAGAPISLMALSADPTVQASITRLDEAANDLDVIENELFGRQAALANAAPDDTLVNRAVVAHGFVAQPNSRIEDVISFLHNDALATNTIGAFRSYVTYLYEIIVFADGWFYDAASNFRTSAAYKVDAVAGAWGGFLAVVESLVAFDKGGDAVTQSAVAGQENAGGPMNLFRANAADSPRNRIINNANYGPTVSFTAAGTVAANDAPYAGAVPNTREQRRLNALRTLRTIADRLVIAVNDLVSIGRERYRNAENGILEQLPAYRNLIAGVNATLTTVPPSGAIAGVYSQVDRETGVWKAPGNVSLSAVNDLTMRFNQSQTDGLNIDTVAGKSINAIRFITGWGFMVMGARTLAGNDNEWRYVSVRRFFNMVEESIKKSTMWAVFEPNDATTWTKVKGMIDNFLTLQWRAGALQGAKPEESFRVKVGLGQTMTSLDILEGRMIVEIEMAVVRPGEFIILTFSHMMVQSG